MRIYLVVVLTLALAGCAPGGLLLSTATTQTELSEPNYRIVAHDVRGSADATYLLSLTSTYGPVVQTLALARISGSASLYSDAIHDLWQNVASRLGQVDGRRLSLINIRYDFDVLNLILVNHVRVIVSADVVEFSEPPR